MGKLALKGGEPVRKKPFPLWPIFDKSDEDALIEVLRSRKWWMYSYGTEELVSGSTKKGERSKIELFEESFARYHRAKYGIAVTSGTAALEICCRAIGLKPGDEVITTPYTFIATSTCILNNFAIPIYVDIDRETYNINPELIEKAITDRTKAIIPVHFAGEMADVERICHIAKKYNIRVIEDAAQAQGVSLEGDRFAGTFGDLGIFSFQESKVLTCGEGGLILTNDDRLKELVWSLRHIGRERHGLWYEHFRLGWNYRPTEFQGALLLTQLARLEEQNQKRSQNVDYFFKEIKKIEGITPIKLHPKATRRSHYLVILRYDKKAWKNISRNIVIEALVAEGIPASTGYTFPSYENPMFERLDMSLFNPRDGRLLDFKRYRNLCSNAERACREEAIWFPHYVFLGESEDINDTVNAFRKIFENINELSL